MEKKVEPIYNEAGLKDWLNQNGIELSPRQWVEQCMGKLGYTPDNKMNGDTHRGVWRRPSKKYRKEKKR